MERFDDYVEASDAATSSRYFSHGADVSDDASSEEFRAARSRDISRMTPLSTTSELDITGPAKPKQHRGKRGAPSGVVPPKRRAASSGGGAPARRPPSFAPVPVFSAPEAMEDNSMAANGLVDQQPDPPPLSVPSPEHDEVMRRLGKPLGSGHCFACRFARDSTVAPITRQGITEMNTLYRSYPAGANKVDLVLEMEEFFERHVRAKANRQIMDGETECPSWSAANIYEHYFTPLHGRIDSQSSVEMRASQLEMLFHHTYTYCAWEHRDSESGVPVIVPKTAEIEKLLKISAALDRMYQIKPSSMALASTNAPSVGRSAQLLDTSRRRVVGANPSRRL